MRKALFVLAALAVLLPFRFVQAGQATTTQISVKTGSTTASVQVWLCEGTQKGPLCTGLFHCTVPSVPANSSVMDTCVTTYTPTAFEYMIQTGGGGSCDNLGQNPIGTTVRCSDADGTVRLKVSR
jgi:hypothetical protein